MHNCFASGTAEAAQLKPQTVDNALNNLTITGTANEFPSALRLRAINNSASARDLEEEVFFFPEGRVFFRGVAFLRGVAFSIQYFLYKKRR